MPRRFRRLARAALTATALVAPAGASAQYAPADRPGPALGVPAATLAASLACSAGIDGATREPVLLVPGTGATPTENFSWNWQPALEQAGIPWCSVTVPYNSVGDVQIAAEYIVNAIRETHRRAGRRIAVVGHSQGGMSPRWALRFWPDTRALVADQIGFAPSHHGSDAGLGAAGFCGVTGCPGAIWQQASGSAFVRALDSGRQTFAEVDYTAVYTRYDQVVFPNDRSKLTPGSNVANVLVQDVCAANIAEHLVVGTIDAAAYALGLDAITHDGPAAVARFDATVCQQPFMPGARPPGGGAQTGTNYLTRYNGVPLFRAEPPLRCYALAAGC